MAAPFGTLYGVYREGGREVSKKVIILALALVLAVGLVAAGCGDEEQPDTTTAPTTAPDTTTAPTTAPDTTTAPTTAETINLTFSCHNPPGNAISSALVEYAKYIEENSGGRVKIDVQVGGALYSNQEIFDGLRTGGADAGTYVIDSGDGFYYNTIMSLPFIGYKDTPSAVDIHWTLFQEFPEMAQEFLDLGLAKGTQFMMPPVHVNFHEPNVVVTTPDQLEGMTLLTLESYVAEWFNMLGASTEQPAFPDLFPMIENRATDGYIQHLNFLGGFDLVDDFQSHTIFGDGGVFMGSIGAVWNKDSWESLPDDIKQIAIDGQQVYFDTAYAGSQADYEKAMGQAKAENHTITELTPEQIQVWHDALASVYTDWVKNAPDPAVAQRMLDRLMELTSK
jgi:TRAP-type C4-dicarboxylate transport system substrate-binding protein